MDLKDFAKLAAQKRKKLDAMMRRQMPVIAGRLAKDHFQDNFRRGGFVNGGLHPWPKARRLASGGTDAASQHGTLLSGRKHLYNSIQYVPSDYRVRVYNEVAYASIHNWGGTVSVTVTDRMKRFAWAKFYEASGKSGKAATGGKKGRKSVAGKQTVSPQASFWKNLALTRKKKLNIRIPQRQFLGESEELTTKINERIEKEIRNILNL